MSDPAADFDLLVAERPDLSDLSVEQIAPIEARMTDWPETWRDIARSIYMTLISRPASASAARTGGAFSGPVPPAAAAGLAVELMMGIAADLGGAQPYINCGSELRRSRMATRVMALLAEHRQDYPRVAKAVGMSERHVRRIELRWLRAERAKRQGLLEFE
jgi:hypothetical protein